MHVSRLTQSSGSGAVVLSLLISYGVTAGSAPSVQNPAPQPPTADVQRCAALISAEGVPEAPTRVTAARLVDVPAADPQQPASVLAASPIKQYCQVLGYVAPQNKFELRLPLPRMEPEVSPDPVRRVLRRRQRQFVQLHWRADTPRSPATAGTTVRSDSTACGRPTARTCRKTSPGGTTT